MEGDAPSFRVETATPGAARRRPGRPAQGPGGVKQKKKSGAQRRKEAKEKAASDAEKKKEKVKAKQRAEKEPVGSDEEEDASDDETPLEPKDVEDSVEGMGNLHAAMSNDRRLLNVLERRGKHLAKAIVRLHKYKDSIPEWLLPPAWFLASGQLVFECATVFVQYREEKPAPIIKVVGPPPAPQKTPPPPDVVDGEYTQRPTGGGMV